ncbi:hypothetical protein Aperf_G00000113211 [Anoplocephala perfoliata]
MSYPSQWPNNSMIPAGTNLSAQGETIQNTAIFSPFPTNTPIRQPPIHMQISQAHPGQNAAGFCPAPPAYSIVYSPLVAAFAAQSNAAVQSGQGPRFCIPQPSPGTNAAAAAAFRGAALLSAPTALQAAAAPPQQAQTAPAQQLPPLSYFPAINGLPLAPAFPGTAAAPSFPPHGASIPQQHGGPSLSTQFRAYDSLKHFGALPQTTSHKKNRSMTMSKTNLYITGLSESDTDETVRALVEDIVHPKSCKAMLLNGKCKGSGFIDCVTAEDAVKALNHLTEMSRNGGRQLIVKYALENEKDSYNIYVRNLPKTNFSKEALMSLFTPYGQVTSVKLLETEGVYTGIGFVRFASAEQAQHAVESVNEKRYILCGEGDSANGNGAMKPVTCKLADKADPKRRAAAAAAAAVAASGTVPLTTSPSGGPSSSRAKFHNPRHGQHHAQTQVLPPQQPQHTFDMHLQSQQQQHQQTQNMASALAALNPNNQIPPGLIYQAGMVPDTTGLFAAAAAAGYLPTANGPIPSLFQPSPRIAPTEAVPVATNAATSGTPTSSATGPTGLLEMPALQASPSSNVDPTQQQQAQQQQQQLSQQQSQHHLLPHPQVAAVNGHSPSAVDSRYAAHVAAFAAANNAMIYPTSTNQFPRVTSQQPLGQPTYSIANPHQAQQNPYGQPSPVDLTAEQFHSLTLAAAAAAAAGRQPGQPQPFYPDWPTVAGFQAGVPAPYQPVTSGSDAAYMDQALAAAALLNSYVQIPPPPPPPSINQTQRLPVRSTPPPAVQVVENVEPGEDANPEAREPDDSKFVSTTAIRTKSEGKSRVNDRESVDKIRENAAPEEMLKKEEEDKDNCIMAGSVEEKQLQAVSTSS